MPAGNWQIASAGPVRANQTNIPLKVGTLLVGCFPNGSKCSLNSLLELFHSGSPPNERSISLRPHSDQQQTSMNIMHIFKKCNLNQMIGHTFSSFTTSSACCYHIQFGTFNIAYWQFATQTNSNSRLV